MKRLLLLSSLALASVCSAADVSVSVTMGAPGFYGRIDIGDIPHPELIFSKPMIIKPVVGIVRPPIYLHVPSGHAKDWGRHCHKYNACGERVFFVHDHWYNDIYVPHHRAQHGKFGKDTGGKKSDKGKHKD